MFSQLWGAVLEEADWQRWIANGHDVGLLSVNGLLGHAPTTMPTHFVADGSRLLIQLARPNPVWAVLEYDPNVTFTVLGDRTPGPWHAATGIEPTDGGPSGDYAVVQFTCQAHIVDGPEDKAALLRRQTAHFRPDGSHGSAAADQPPYARLLSGVRGLILNVTEAKAKFRYDGHEPVG
ncbi:MULTISPECIES: FMN-binding negative transcriptional regulator [Streptomyces]|uniref:FMN-binding negative transcriptional regulator n=1 Tax=Streptomyces TaxID=1883 RepID=UPI00287FEC31|nr:FMN-binding negative transcriptional regulator [Streptomyces sp. CGMCC 4.1456]WNF62054.1 FMN-binding negative transcriptional regulator [Streptomyces sp. CGMCC 4.1456]